MRNTKLMGLGLAVMLLFTGCGATTASTPDTDTNVITETDATEDTATEDATPEDAIPSGEETSGGAVIVYFANWNLDNKPAEQGGEVAGIPWDKVSYINHAFWAVAPADGSTRSSIEQRNSGEGARTAFKIVSTDAKSDYEDTTPSAVNADMPRNHFAEYAAYSEQYPDVNVMISIGGWSRSGYFSEMAYTEEGRQSCIQSCLDLMDEYPWIDGIDIDWEYPAGSKDGERASEGNGDEGCPIFGSASEDNANFATFLSELRTALDEHFGKGSKKLTACASASTGWTLPCQDWAAFAPYLDMINIMTYDLAGVWDDSAGHAGSFISAKSAAVYFKMLDIPMSKLCIGSPLYTTTLLLKEVPSTGIAIGAPIEGYKPVSEEMEEAQVEAFEAEAVSGYTVVRSGSQWVLNETFDNGGVGWHQVYDDKKGGAYLYNDDEASPYYKWFISYENHLSLQEKLDYIRDMGLAGIIVWETSQDDAQHSFVTQMGDNLIP
ncbi:MAG: hypothetical protein IJ833_05095 [Lachnospiraceae bacterium]|nr:hypothetical protein [Lachnospiraceae bacterium]